jgi:hypothetical protein
MHIKMIEEVLDQLKQVDEPVMAGSDTARDLVPWTSEGYLGMA